MDYKLNMKVAVVAILLIAAAAVVIITSLQKTQAFSEPDHSLKADPKSPIAISGNNNVYVT
jgi:hypothetical protein